MDISDEAPGFNPPLSQFGAYDNTHGSGIFTNDGCPTAITTDQTRANALLPGVNAMTAGSTSNDVLMNIGMAWAWRLLSQNWNNSHNNGTGPWGGFMNSLNLPLDYGTPGRKKIIILVSSGQDVAGASDYNAYGYASAYNNPSGYLDPSLLALCNAFKNIDPENNIIYTIGYGPASYVNTALLQSCATTPAYSYLATTDQGLYFAMESLGHELQVIEVRQ